MSFPSVPVSVGELIDKITILQIKQKYSNNEYIIKELNSLIKIAEDLQVYKQSYLDDLMKVNQLLWDIEDRIRIKEKENEFDHEFIQLARSVYKENDRRAVIKRKINEETNSTYKEIKIY
jgi:predicted DNA-binding protein YlxM (UPF0122 family)